MNASAPMPPFPTAMSLLNNIHNAASTSGGVHITTVTSDFHYLELTELSRRLHKREISPVEATTAQLARIE
jgi:hypothetical protein